MKQKKNKLKNGSIPITGEDKLLMDQHLQDYENLVGRGSMIRFMGRIVKLDLPKLLTLCPWGEDETDSD